MFKDKHKTKMTTPVSSNMKELSAILSELKIVNVKVRELRERKKVLESNILEYLDETEENGLRYRDLVVLRKETTTRERKKQKDKEVCAIQALEKMGVEEAKKMYDAMMTAMKGPSQQTTRLSLKTDVSLVV